MPKKQTHYDVIVIGAGPAGFASAIRCAQLGLKTACIDNWRNKKSQSRLGGSHLNTGGVASMTLLESAKIYHQLQPRDSKTRHSCRCHFSGFTADDSAQRQNYR